MTNPPKKKGTGGETELLRLLAAQGITFLRTPASTPYDLEHFGTSFDPNDKPMLIEALATRPDRGQWLVTVDLPTFAILLNGLMHALAAMDEEPDVHIEVKRYARFSLHTIFEGKFGGNRGRTSEA